MATEEHKHLADIIKNIHATLREEAQNYGPDVAWKRHITHKDVLQKYASSMEKLATTYWMSNNLNAESVILCRVEWITSQCKEYFLNGGRQKYDEREEDIKRKMSTNCTETEHSSNCNLDLKSKESCTSENLDDTLRGSTDKIMLLDVGSCYNPFGNINMFDVTAIDLNGIPNKVLKCDFLNVHIGKEKIFSDDKEEMLQLAESSYDVIVFSLFLEYLPCPKQRYVCCKKAYDLLQSRGILYIISPDSKHVSANAKLIKSWRYVLSKLGFMRIKYEKLRHIHCMIFRKCVLKCVALRWANLQTIPENDPLYETATAIYIPQDFRNVSSEVKQNEKKEYNVDEITFMFGELPFDEM
ncbi:S-adenosylmethionine sensor upstream of mTORC1 isoform X1 [Hylaeus anthracinus]|uniref:S-adenosylmethionine sensor upstream of mTORC1 isoform X1 n=1 Tax=Hylaeus anthracinus TaxID=313031 RepID=UPI0023B8CB56|nr:S-adenosylmethionine sensor upstream of mTORC1 isoform X1 [Hylaeus anthracinus]